jgi:nitrite reductase (NADH) small subunit
MAEHESRPTAPRDAAGWTEVCGVEDVIPGTAVAALVGGLQVALVRSRNGERFYALSNFDPFSNAFVIARGIVGDRGGVAKIASPIYKQSFALETGQCLDDPSVVLPVFPVRIAQDRVWVSTTPSKRSPR